MVSHPSDGDLFHRVPGSEWVRWKQVSSQDAQVEYVSVGLLLVGENVLLLLGAALS